MDYNSIGSVVIKSNKILWKKETTTKLKINIVDCSLEDMFNNENILLSKAAKDLLLPEWVNGDWLGKKENLDEDTTISDPIKALLEKIKSVYITRINFKDYYVDGFMMTFLTLLQFDHYPCLLFPQYQYDADFINDKQQMVAQPDFGIISKGQHEMLLVYEDNKTMSNARYANNWKEDHVLGELFIAAHHHAHQKYYDNVIYPITIYAIRVVGTYFTFYKTVVSELYIEESLMGYPKVNSMQVQRLPKVHNKAHLTAYDICDKKGRENILKCMSSIEKFLKHE